MIHQRVFEPEARERVEESKSTFRIAVAYDSRDAAIRAMYVIGMHPKASRLARTVRYPTLVFNLHEQFERLRACGKFETMKQRIRAREMAFQGSINPMLRNFSESSEACQYSGRVVPDSWSCPFHAHKREET